MSLDMIHPEVLYWSSFTKKLLHSFQSEWAYKSVNSQRSCCRFLRRWHYNTEKKYIIRYSLMEFIKMVSVPQGVNDSPIRSLGESTLAVESDLPKDRLRAGWKTSLGASETVWLDVCLSGTLAPSAVHRRCRFIGSVIATTSSAEQSARS